MPDAPGASRQGPGRGTQLAEQFVHPGEALLRALGDVCGLVMVPEDPTIERRDRDIYACGAQVSDQHVARLCAKAQLPWWPAARARAGFALDQEARVR